MNKQALRDLAAQAMSSGAPVQRLATGDSLGLSARDWKAIVTSPHKVTDFELLHTSYQGRAPDPIDERRFVTLNNGTEIVVNGYGEAL